MNSADQILEWHIKAADAATCCDQNRLADAEARANESLALHPDGALALRVLGIVAMKRLRFADAVPLLTRSLAIQPGDALCHNSLGHSYYSIGDTNSALAHFDRAVFLQPDLGVAHFNRASALLKLGRFEEGWLEYEWRWPSGLVRGPAIPRPRWDGGPIDGRTILVHTEQGAGDVLMGLRFLAPLRDLGANVVFACHHPLEPLLRSSNLVPRWFPMHAPEFDSIDLYTPLWSLPRLLGCDVASPTATEKYVAADPDHVNRWCDRLAGLPGRKIGICWQGSRTAENDGSRSPPLREFRALARVPSIQLVSLQKGAGEEQIAAERDALRLKVFDELDRHAAFMDSAAIIEQLDLVITCDTSIAHLAGALGRPVWLLLSTTCDWRWGERGSTTPWYPSMRLFRQSELGDWPGVFGDVAERLQAKSNASK